MRKITELKITELLKDAKAAVTDFVMAPVDLARSEYGRHRETHNPAASAAMVAGTFALSPPTGFGALAVGFGFAGPEIFSAPNAPLPGPESLQHIHMLCREIGTGFIVLGNMGLAATVTEQGERAPVWMRTRQRNKARGLSNAGPQ